MPVRLMVCSLILKRIYNLRNETLATARGRAPYMQHFFGYSHFEHHLTCNPSDFVHLRKWMGKEGAKSHEIVKQENINQRQNSD